jgi:hypothetical protein
MVTDIMGVLMLVAILRVMAMVIAMVVEMLGAVFVQVDPAHV